MHNSQIGYIGEQCVFAELAKLGWIVYQDLSGKGPYDCIIFKENRILTVQVKSSSSRTQHNTGWAVGVGSVRSNKTQNVVHKFDNTKQDILAIYLNTIDKVIFFVSSDVNVGRMLAVTDQYLQSYSHPQILL